MTPVFCCGFECGLLNAAGHFSSASGFSIDTTTKRTGSRSLKCLNVASGIYSTCTYSPSFILGGVARAYFYFSVLPNVDVDLIFMDANTGVQQGSARFVASDSKIYARTNTNGATGVSVTTGAWYRIDMKYNVTANPNLCDVSVNGVACGQASQSAAAETINDFRLCMPTANSTMEVYIDDVIISNTLADYPIGAGYINHFIPTSDGTHNVAGAADFRRGDTTTDILNSTTTAYQLVDDVPMDDTTPDTDDHIRIVAPPNVTDYVECIYGAAPGISTPTIAPRAVEVIAEFFAAGTGLSDEILKLSDNGTVSTVYDGTQIAGTTTGIYKRKHYATAPTGGAWTVVSGNGNFNDIRFRYGFATDANPDKSLMCTMIEAEFQEIAAIPNKIKSINQAVNRSNTY